jgi:hypothetical protein
MNYRNRIGSLSIVLSLLWFAAAPGTLNAQISVIVSSSSHQTADASFLKQVFSASRFSWPDGEKILVVEQAGTPVGKSFYEEFVGTSVSETRKTWLRLVLSGEAIAPVKCANDEEVKRQVALKPNSVGFISAGELDNSVKEIYRIR